MRKRTFEYLYNTNKGQFLSFILEDFKRQILKDSSVSVVLYATSNQYKTMRNTVKRKVYIITSRSLVDNARYILSDENNVKEPKEFSDLDAVKDYLVDIVEINEKSEICKLGKKKIYFEESVNM